MYSITSVFRSETGLLPGYAMVHSTPGEYEFEKEIILLSEERLYVVKRAIVHPPTAGLVLGCRRGHYAVSDDLYQGGLLTSIDNAPLFLREPRKTIDDDIIPQMAVYAAFWMRGMSWKIANKTIRELTIADIRSKPMSMREWYSGRRYIFDFTKLKKYQVYSWLYHTLVIMFRIGSLTAPRKDDRIHIKLGRIWWRDMVLAVLHHLNVDFSLSLEKTLVIMKMSRREFHRMLTRLLRENFERKATDFDFIDAVVSKSCVILDKDGEIDIDDGMDIPDKIIRTQVDTKMSEFINIFISFPEIDDIIEANGLIL